VFVDETIILFDRISVSAGARGTQLILAPDDYLRAASRHRRAGADCGFDERHEATHHGGPRKTRRHKHDPRSLDASQQGLRIEWRSLDAMISMLFFSGLVVVLFSIAFDPRGEFSQQISGGVLCGGHHVRFGERAQSGMGARNPASGDGCATHGSCAGSGTFSGQGHREFLFVTIVQVILAPFFFVFYNLHIAGNAWLLVLCCRWHMGAGQQRSLLRRALHEQPQSRVLLSLISFPSSFRAARDGAIHHPIFTGDSDPTLWIKMLLGYDIIFTTASLLLFDTIFHAE